jgi:hypothetical protein
VNESDSDFSYLSDTTVRVKVIQVRILKTDDARWQKIGVIDVGSPRHDFTVTSTGPQINMSVENIPKDYFILFLTKNLVQGFVDETKRHANSSMSSK